MNTIALSAGIVVGLVASTVVYADAARRDSSQSARLLWPVGVGVVTLAGFLLPYSFDDALHRAYFAWVKSAAVATSPYEMLALHLVVGIAISAGSVLLYGFGSRHGRS